MKLPKYQLKATKKLTVFEFESVGEKGEIPKLIKYSETNLKHLYNLAFGDKHHLTGEIDDKVISNNGDSEKVLATVVASLFAFTDKYPEAHILATGSTKSRTRLYRMGISKYIIEIISNFHIYGLRNGNWESFEKEVDYEAFLANRKKH